MKTHVTKPSDIERSWYLIDAKNETLGRLATKVADLLRGKNKVNFSPSLDMGDFVVVINTAKIKTTGNKLKDKMYYSYSGYQSGLRELTLEEVLEKDANKVIYEAVKGMLPKNKLQDVMLKKLKLFVDDKHIHEAQKPEILEITGKQ